MTHAVALRNIVATVVFRAALHANVFGWTPEHATWEPPPGRISLGALRNISTTLDLGVAGVPNLLTGQSRANWCGAC